MRWSGGNESFGRCGIRGFRVRVAVMDGAGSTPASATKAPIESAVAAGGCG